MSKLNKYKGKILKFMILLSVDVENNVDGGVNNVLVVNLLKEQRLQRNKYLKWLRLAVIIIIEEVSIFVLCHLYQQCLKFTCKEVIKRL